MMLKGMTHQEDLTMLNVYIPNGFKIHVAKLIGPKEEISKPTMKIKDFKATLSVTDRTSKYKIS